MKKTLTTIILFAVFISFSNTSQAQLKYGGGINFSTWLNTPGLNLRAEFGIADLLVAVPMIDIGMPRFSTATFMNAASLHLHYNFPITEELQVYPLAGLALKSYLDFDRYGTTNIYHRFGINPVGGAGGKIKLTDSFEVFAEGRLEVGRYSQFVTTLGVLMSAGK